jgi:c-di-GMP phosphodiesterase
MNLSAQLLHDPQLSRLVSDAIGDAATSGDQLELEITESAVMADPEGALTTITDLTSRGVRFTIDDFGTGYSSLAYLKRIPVRSIKIDQSFVRDIATDERDASIVRSAIELAHSLDITVVAEGVETRHVWERLRDLSCDYVQGYYVARPMPSTDVAPWIRTRGAVRGATAQTSLGPRRAPGES